MMALALFAHLVWQMQYVAIALPATAPSFVGLQMVVHAPLAMPDGGPQAMEGYTRLEHDRGVTRLALGTIGNVENNARGETAEVRSLQGGGVITNDGRVRLWSGLVLQQPQAGEGYTGPVHVDEYRDIVFANGWYIRPDGDRLLICSPKGVCHGL